MNLISNDFFNYAQDLKEKGLSGETFTAALEISFSGDTIIFLRLFKVIEFIRMVQDRCKPFSDFYIHKNAIRYDGETYYYSAKKNEEYIKKLVESSFPSAGGEDQVSKIKSYILQQYMTPIPMVFTLDKIKRKSIDIT